MSKEDIKKFIKSQKNIEVKVDAKQVRPPAIYLKEILLSPIIHL